MLITIIAIVIQTMAFLLHKETPDCGEHSGVCNFLYGKTYLPLTLLMRLSAAASMVGFSSRARTNALPIMQPRE